MTQPLLTTEERDRSSQCCECAGEQAGVSRETPHLKRSWDSKVRSAGRHWGTGFRRAALKVCWKLARAAAETETQTQLVSSAFPSQAATAAD